MRNRLGREARGPVGEGTGLYLLVEEEEVKGPETHSGIYLEDFPAGRE